MAELIVAIGVLSLVLIFFILISGQMLVLTAKTQTLDLTVSLAQSKIEELRSTLTIPEYQQDEPKPGYIRTMTSTLIMETGTTTPVKFLRKVTVSVQGPASLGSKRTVLETFIQTFHPQIAFDFPNTNIAFVSSSETLLHGWLRDDGHNINANQVTYRTSSNQGVSWTSTTAVSGIYSDFACAGTPVTTLVMGRTYYFQLTYSGGADGTITDILVQATNESGDSSSQPNGPQAMGSWIRLITDAIKPSISLTTTPSFYVSSSFSAEITASDIRSGIRDVFLVVKQSGTSTYWDETVLNWVAGGPIYNYAEQKSGDSYSGIWRYPPTLSPSIRQAFDTAISSCAPGTMLDVQAFALDSAIGKKYDYRNLIPTQRANLPWLNVKANFQASNLVNLKKIAAPSVTVGIPDPIWYNSATLKGAVNPNGAATNAWFEWGTDENYGFSTDPTNVGDGLGNLPITAPLTGLAPGTIYHFRLAASNVAGTSYSTPASFSTLGGSGIVVTAPNGGEIWSIGSSRAITWISSGISGDVKIELSRNGGFTWTETISSSVPYSPGSYAWTVTGTASANCRVRVSSLSTPGATDSSDNDFTIREAPDITVTSPIGGEAWYIGSNHNITWSSVSISGNVKIELSRNEGATWPETIASGVPYSPGSYTWTVTGPASAACRVKITSLSDPSVYDQSPSNFSVTLPPSITVISPNGGDNGWWIGSVQTIAWTSNGISGNVEIRLSRDGGTSYNEILAASVPCSPGSYSWTPIGPASSNCKIKITSITTPSIWDTSDNTFVIPAASITITNPNGSAWYIGSTYSIQWTSLNLGGNVKIELSRDNGVTYAVIAASVPVQNQSFSWTVTGPVTATKICKIKITSLTDPLINMASVLFRIRS